MHLVKRFITKGLTNDVDCVIMSKNHKKEMEDIYRIKRGDCLELMKQIPDNGVDLTVTSPPYDNLRTYNDNIDQWNFEKFKKIAKELYRVTKDGGVVVWNVADATIKGDETGTSFKQALYFKECGFNLHDTMIWFKPNCFNFGSNNCYKQSFEYMFVFSKGKPNAINLIKDVKAKCAGNVLKGARKHADGKRDEVPDFVCQDYKRRYNVWSINVASKTYGHSAVFPEQLANDHIISWSNEGDLVFDPFLGSGTTGKMAILNNRKFLGFEIDEEYFEIAKNRLKETELTIDKCDEL